MSVQFSDEVEVHPLMDRCEVQVLKSGTARTRAASSDMSSSEEEIYFNHASQDQISTKPLMAPRQRTKVRIHKPRRKWKPWVKPCIYLIVLFSSIGALVYLVLYFLNAFAPAVFHFGQLPPTVPMEVVGCSNIEVEDVWIVGYPKLLTESAFRMLDVNQDGILDVVFGFGTGADGYNRPPIVCKIYFSGNPLCGGGLLALDGKTGKELWRHYSNHEAYAVNCQEDLDNDGVKDCLAAGRAGMFDAVSGKTGALLWRFDNISSTDQYMNLYTAQYVPDVTGDGIPEVLNIHGGDPMGEPGSKTRKEGNIVVFDGKTGHPLRTVVVPDHTESYYSPVLFTRADGTVFVLYGTGGETHPGSLWYITFDDLYRGHIDMSVKIVSDAHKGVMTPPVILDLNNDGQEDIVLSMYNSSTLAVDGKNFNIMWNFTFPWSESYATPAPGFYNEDEIPDFMIKQQYGPGFPLFYYSVSTVIDGKTGKALIEPYIRDTVGAQASPLTVSMEGLGNDIFLYWFADCVGQKNDAEWFKFVAGTNVHEQSRSDFCRLRYKSKGYSKLMALTRHIQAPGTTLYYSVERNEAEHSKWINTTQEALHFVENNPEYRDDYEYFQRLSAKRKYLEKLWKFRKGKGKYFGRKTIKHLDKPMPHRETSRKHAVNYNKNYNRNDLSGNKPARPDDKNDRYQSSHNEDAVLDDENVHDKVSDIVTNILKKKGYNNVPYFAGGQFKERNVHPTDKYGYDTKLKMKYPRETSSISMGSDGHFPAESIKGSRKRRHIGPHDEGGLQRLLSTGTLAPSLLNESHPDFPHSVDIIFATYWFFPAKTKVILPESQECIDEKMKNERQRFQPTSEYYGMDHDGYGHAVTDECLEETGHDSPDNLVYQSQKTYNPYDVHMGQMSVYRLRIKCNCKGNKDVETGKKRCSQVLPFDKQGWAAYMGTHGNSHWNTRSNI